MGLVGRGLLDQGREVDRHAFERGVGVAHPAQHQQVVDDGGEPVGAAGHGRDRVARGRRQVGQRLDHLDVAHDHAERVLQLVGDGRDQLGAIAVEPLELGDQLLLTLVGAVLEDRAPQVVGDVERGPAVVLGPAGAAEVAGEQHQPQGVGPGADRHQHELAGPVPREVVGQVRSAGAVEGVVAPDPAGFDDDDRLRRPGPQRGRRDGRGEVGLEVRRPGPLVARRAEDLDREVVGAEAGGEVAVGTPQQVGQPGPARRRPHDLAGRGDQPQLLRELLALQRREHRPEDQLHVLGERAQPRGAGPVTVERHVEVDQGPQVAAVVDDPGDEHVERVPAGRVVGVGQVRHPRVVGEAPGRGGGQPLVRDERPGAVLGPERECRLHGGQRRGLAHQRLLALVAPGDRDDLEHVVGAQDLDRAHVEAGAASRVVGDQPERGARLVAAPAVLPRARGRLGRELLGHGPTLSAATPPRGPFRTTRPR